MRRTSWLNMGLATIVLPIAVGCGDHPQVAETRGDLERLSTSETDIYIRPLAESDFSSLARFRQLRALDFARGWGSCDAKITDQGLATLADLHLPHLWQLQLGWCDSITDAGLRHIARMPSLTWLGLAANPHITDAGLAQIANARNLRILDLRGCSYITDLGIQELAANGNWEEIWLGGCPNVTAQGVAELQTALPEASIDKDDQEWEWMID